MEYLVGLVTVVALLATYVTWVAGRIDRLHARVAAAHSALDAQLVRRAAVAAQLADSRRHDLGNRAEEVRAAAKACLGAPLDAREAAENDLTRALHRLHLDASDPLLAELKVTSRRLGVARQVHNDAVRDTLALRRRRLPRALRLGRRHPMPRYFDIAEFVEFPVRAGEPAVAPASPAVGTAASAASPAASPAAALAAGAAGWTGGASDVAEVGAEVRAEVRAEVGADLGGPTVEEATPGAG